MIHRLILLCFVLLMGMLLFYGGVLTLPSPKTSTPQTAQSLDQHIPDVVLAKAGGGTLRLYDELKDVNIINFWATWCPPCIEELPIMVDLVKRYGSRLRLITVSNDLNEAPVQSFQQLLNQQSQGASDRIDMVWALDPYGAITRQRFNVLRLPETFVVNDRGRILRKIVGLEAWKHDDMNAYFAALLEPSTP